MVYEDLRNVAHAVEQADVITPQMQRQIANVLSATADQIESMMHGIDNVAPVTKRGEVIQFPQKPIPPNGAA